MSPMAGVSVKASWETWALECGWDLGSRGKPSSRKFPSPGAGVGALGRPWLAILGGDLRVASPSLCALGVDFRVKNLLVDNKYYALQLWDTAGQER